MLLLYRGNGCDFIHVYLPYTIPDVSNNWTLLHYHQLWFHYRSLASTKISVPWSLNKNHLHVSPPFCVFFFAFQATWIWMLVVGTTSMKHLMQQDACKVVGLWWPVHPTLCWSFLCYFYFPQVSGNKKRDLFAKQQKNAQERRKFGRSSKKESCQVFQGRHHDLKMYFGGNGVKLPSKIYGANTRFCWHCPKQIKLKTNTSSSACALKGSWFWRFWKATIKAVFSTNIDYISSD